MSFDDDIREAAEPVAATPRPGAVLNWFPVPPGKFERAAMAGFCESLTPADWILLEQLDPRLKNALLKQTIAIALKWRARRTKPKAARPGKSPAIEQPTHLAGFAERVRSEAGK